MIKKASRHCDETAIVVLSRTEGPRSEPLQRFLAQKDLANLFVIFLTRSFISKLQLKTILYEIQLISNHFNFFIPTFCKFTTVLNAQIYINFAK